MRSRFHLALLGALTLAACGGRDEEWDKVAGAIGIAQLRDAAIFVDGNLNRGLVVTARADQNLDFASVRIGKNVVSTTTSKDRRRSFVLSRGDDVRLRATDEGPALHVFETGRPREVKRYELPDALSSVALDPAG
ncbi:MAG: hypothetical protein ABW133_06270, partial [Polyangiaceae bacterium]